LLKKSCSGFPSAGLGFSGCDDWFANLPSGLEVRSFDEETQAHKGLRVGAASGNAGLLVVPPNGTLATGFDHAVATEVSPLPKG